MCWLDEAGASVMTGVSVYRSDAIALLNYIRPVNSAEMPPSDPPAVLQLYETGVSSHGVVTTG